MITNTDWRTVNEQLMDDERERLDPPTAEEMLAYTRGELSAEDEQRVREQLVSYPELVRTLTVPFPTEGAKPGDPDYVSDDEYPAHWSALQARMGGPRLAARGRRLDFWRTFAAIAATLAVVLGVGWWQSLSRAEEPRIIEQTEPLLPDGRRGPATPGMVQMRGDAILLVVPLTGAREHVDYRLELIRVANNRTLWRSSAVRPRDDGTYATFPVLVPKEFVDKGEYRIVVHGIAGQTERPIATYSVRFK